VVDKDPMLCLFSAFMRLCAYTFKVRWNKLGVGQDFIVSGELIIHICQDLL